MVARPQEYAAPPEVAARVGELGSAAAVSGAIEALPLDGGDADPFRDVATPVEGYDLRLAGESVGQVVAGGAGSPNAPEPPYRWVLVQKDADLVMSVGSAGEAVERARSIVAARLLSTTPRRPRRGDGRPGRTGIALLVLAAAAACAAAGALAARRGRLVPSRSRRGGRPLAHRLHLR